MSKEQQLLLEVCVEAVYPKWTRQLTPGLGTGRSTGVKNPRVWLENARQWAVVNSKRSIYAGLLQDQVDYFVAKGDPIRDCLELADVQFCERYSNHLPDGCRGKIVPAWKSVMVDGEGDRYVPVLCCLFHPPGVLWINLDDDSR